MKFKVKVELTEGVFAENEFELSAEVVLLILNKRTNNTLKGSVMAAAERAAQKSVQQIFSHFENVGGTLLQRTKGGVRECLAVKDVKEAKEWFSEGSDFRPGIDDGTKK